jgi:hypothetical protein
VYRRAPRPGLSALGPTLHGVTPSGLGDGPARSSSESNDVTAAILRNSLHPNRLIRHLRRLHSSQRHGSSRPASSTLRRPAAAGATILGLALAEELDPDIKRRVLRAAGISVSAIRRPITDRTWTWD